MIDDNEANKDHLETEEFLDLEEYLRAKYLEYSIAVLKDRAIPYLSD